MEFACTALPVALHNERVTSPLTANGCQSLCAWSPTGDVRAGERLFRCSGCESEWVVSEPWTPADADGTVSPAVLAERARA